MMYPSDDEFSDELPDIQLLLEQRIVKSTKEKVALPPSLFDPVTLPKPKPKSRSQSEALDPTIKSKVTKKEAVSAEILDDDSAPRIPKEMKPKKGTAIKKQNLEAVAQETTTTEKSVKAIGTKAGSSVITYPKVSSLITASSALSDYLDHSSVTRSTGERIQPTSQRRRRLILKKYLTSDDDDDDDDDSDDSDDGNVKEREQETVKKLRREIVNFTFSSSGEMPLQTQQPGFRAEKIISEDEGFESHGNRSTLDDIRGATLTYSPPRSSKPLKVLPSEDPSTTRKLSSPKKTPRIPPSQHRLSSDAFWDQGITDNWIDSHTPHKTPHKRPGVVRDPFNTTDDYFLGASEEGDDDEEIKRPTASRTTSSASSRSIMPKGSKEKIESKRAFNARKKQLAEEFLKTVDDKISNGEVARKTASAGGVKIVWSKTLRTTAGTARWRMEKLQSSSGQVSLGDPLSIDRVRHHATIDLSEKVVDSEEKLYNVICHEYCHLANYMVSNVRKPPHGESFKKWASLCSRAFSNLNVHVTTTHSYEIEAKFKWSCQACGYVYKRHSQSIDTTRHTCGACKGGKLAQTHPPPKEKRPITGYQAFMKENFGRIKAENPGTPQKEVMKIVAEAYRATKSVGVPEKSEFVEVGKKEGELEDMFGGLKV